MTRPPRSPQPPSGGPTPSSLDRSASHHTPPSSQAKYKPLDRANTTRAPGSKVPGPQALPLAKSQSQQGPHGRGRGEAGPPPPGTATAGLTRQPTQGKQQQQGAALRRRDKTKENEDVIRQLQAICSPGDPNIVYRSLQKIGQGFG